MTAPTASADMPFPDEAVRPFRAALTPCGVVDDQVHADYLGWLSEGRNAGMEYLRNHLPLRRDPSLVLEGARSVIVLAFPYADVTDRPLAPVPLRGAVAEEALPQREALPPRGAVAEGALPLARIAAYAHGRDYHDAIREYLAPDIDHLRETLGGDWRLCIDSAPVRERYWAVRSGLATRTLSGNVYVPGLGTRHFLAILLSTLPPEAIRPTLTRLWGGTLFPSPSDSSDCSDCSNCSDNSNSSDIHPLCRKCGACRRACPGRAIHADGTIDARRCISYLTIEHRGDWTTPEALEVMQGPGTGWLFGCDTCLRVCPLNSRKCASQGEACQPQSAPLPPSGAVSEGALPQPEGHIPILPSLLPDPRISLLTPADILAMTQEDFSRTFRGSPIKRAKLAGLRRNAGNTLTR